MYGEFQYGTETLMIIMIIFGYRNGRAPFKTPVAEILIKNFDLMVEKNRQFDYWFY